MIVVIPFRKKCCMNPKKREILRQQISGSHFWFLLKLKHYQRLESIILESSGANSTRWYSKHRVNECRRDFFFSKYPGYQQIKSTMPRYHKTVRKCRISEWNTEVIAQDVFLGSRGKSNLKILELFTTTSLKISHLAPPASPQPYPGFQFLGARPAPGWEELDLEAGHSS